MAKSILFASLAPNATTFGNTRYASVGTGYFETDSNYTEAIAQLKCHEAGTFSKMCVYVTTNTANNTSTINFRKNGANGTQTISIASGASNSFFEDSSGTDTVAANDLVCYQLLTTASGSGSIFFKNLRILYNAPSSTISRYSLLSTSAITTSASVYYGIAGTWSGNSLSENFGDAISGTACTLSKARYHAILNTRTGGSAGAFRTWIDPGDASLAAEGNINVVVNVTPDVEDEDNSNSDTIAVGDAISYTMLRPGASGNWFPGHFNIQMDTSNKKFMMVNSRSNSTYIQTSAITRYYSVAGAQASPSTTEDDLQLLMGISARATYLGCNVSVSASPLDSGSTTVTLRKNAATDTSLSVSIASGAGTGNFTDTSNSTDLVSTDEIDIKVVTGGTSGDIRFKTFYSTYENTDVTTRIKDVIRPGGMIPWKR